MRWSLLLALPLLAVSTVAVHEAVHCTLAYAGGAQACTVDLMPGPCPQPDMTMSGYCLGTATAHREHAPLSIVEEEVVAYTGGAIPWLAYLWGRSLAGKPSDKRHEPARKDHVPNLGDARRTALPGALGPGPGRDLLTCAPECRHAEAK